MSALIEPILRADSVPADDSPALYVSTQRRVSFHQGGDGSAAASTHDLRTKRAVAQALAELIDGNFTGDLDTSAIQAHGIGDYLVPSHTLCGSDAARALGIRGPQDFFGGIVPHAFVASKVITHGLVRVLASAPEGWSHSHAAWIESVVLPGYSAFTVPDVREAAQRLFARGSVRLKLPEGVGGLGQQVVRDADELEAFLARLDDRVLGREGLVVERNLRDVRTLSVGQVQVGDAIASYVGTQGLTHNGQGHEVYGGSRLHMVRGGLGALLDLPLDDPTRLAVRQARCYHDAAQRAYPGLTATRANYDVAQGTDDEGQWRSGVLEQSWRIGGASGAEIAGLKLLRRDPKLRAIQASTHEVYDAAMAAPVEAWVTYDGADHHGDRLLKYVLARPVPQDDQEALRPAPLGRRVAV